jgi:uncharacterized membrane protein (GlpM family)
MSGANAPQPVVESIGATSVNWKSMLLDFVLGGTVTAVIVGFEESNHRLLSGLATLVPIFTLVSYLILGETKGGVAVGHHSWMVLVGTLVSWVPYMIVVAVMAPKVGATKAVGLGLVVFFILAIGYLVVVDRWRLFQGGPETQSVGHVEHSD